MSHLLPDKNDIPKALDKEEFDSLRHIPAAHYLIQKYVTESWKNDPDDVNFTATEIMLCGYIKMLKDGKKSRELILEWIAQTLYVSPSVLHNDPNLPF